MKTDREIPRRSIRVPGWDYSQPGGYFLTLVTFQRECLFGEIHEGEMRLTDGGRTVWDVWHSLPSRYPGICLGSAVVMPNHFHGIIIIEPPGGENPVAAIHELPLQVVADKSLSAEDKESSRLELRRHRRRMTLPLVVGYFKMNTAKRINKILDSEGVPIWQRNYYEHFIRDPGEHERIRLYIRDNIANWESDEDNLQNPRAGKGVGMVIS